jgi:hypothetical protein
MAEFSKLKYSVLLASQVLLLALAVLCVHFGANVVGAVAILGMLVLVRYAQKYRFPVLRRSKPPCPIKSWQWATGLAFLVILAATTVWLFHDSATGAKGSGALLYAFIAALLLCTFWWLGLFMRWFAWWW